MEISYGYSRFGRYSYDIVDVLETIGSMSDCNKSVVLEAAKTVREMILVSLQALQSRDNDAVQKLYEMDDTVDMIYRKYLRQIVTQSGGPKGSERGYANNNKHYNNNNNNKHHPHCYVSSLLILRYLERISDHACYIGDSVHYIVSSPRR
jgi:phosphate transport system protein